MNSICFCKNIAIFSKWVSQNESIIDSYIPYRDDLIRRIAEAGNKVGIYTILCSNSCSREIISYETKINFPTRICFKVPSKKDSINALDKEGANELVGVGNYLMVSSNNNKPKQLKSILVDSLEIQSIIEYTNCTVRRKMD